MAAQVDTMETKYINKPSLGKIERDLPNTLDSLLLVRDLFLAKSNNGKYNVTLRARDACRIYGLCQRSVIMRVAKTMKWLAAKGYLEEVRPGKYRPNRNFIEWSLLCHYPFCGGISSICGLIGVCPVHEYLRAIERKKKRRE